MAQKKSCSVSSHLGNLLDAAQRRKPVALCRNEKKAAKFVSKYLTFGDLQIHEKFFQILSKNSGGFSAFFLLTL